MSMIATQSNPQAHSVSPKGMLIGGQWVESASGARITVENPAKKTPVFVEANQRAFKAGLHFGETSEMFGAR